MKGKEMSSVNKTNPDVLRVTEYILEQNKLDEAFSVQSEANSKEPNGKGSLISCTTVDNQNLDNQFFKWQLNTNSYFSYLSYQSVEQAKKSNKTANTTLKIAIAAMVIAIIMPIITSICAPIISAYIRN